jgi:Mor family transcriptional regulator
MGYAPEAKVERDKDLIIDYKTGKFTTVELIQKYGITAQRISQILKKYEIPVNHPVVTTKHKSNTKKK